jgi:hypothetical protein
MSHLELTEQERAAFHAEVDVGRALDYFYVFDNAPLQFLYRDGVIPGHPTDLEKRNKAITETLWLEAYHQFLVANVVYRFLYRGSVLQMPFQVHQIGAGMFAPPAIENRALEPSAEGVRANFERWMADSGWKLADDMRKQPSGGSWKTLLDVPDRTARIASVMPVGNQVILEMITTWTEDRVLKEAAWVVVLIYDVDGTVVQDRSYIDLVNWPSARRYAGVTSADPKTQRRPVGIGTLDQFFEYHRSRRIEGAPSDLEKRNLAIVEGEWLDAWNQGLTGNLFHPERFRLQLPVQKASCNLAVAREIERVAGEAVPDRSARLGLTHAKGNQVMAEGIVAWIEKGVPRESPLVSFLLLDNSGKVIRERRYITMSNWPGADELMSRLGLKEEE